MLLQKILTRNKIYCKYHVNFFVPSFISTQKSSPTKLVFQTVVNNTHPIAFNGCAYTMIYKHKHLKNTCFDKSLTKTIVVALQPVLKTVERQAKLTIYVDPFFKYPPPPVLLPVLGLLERYMTPKLDVARLCRAGSDLGRTSDWLRSCKVPHIQISTKSF